jgi:hypothetical protein
MAGGITALSELLNRLTPELPGCPTVLITQNIQDVLRDFCTQTECWLIELTQNLVAGTVAYTLAPTQPDADIRRIVSVTIEDNSIPLDPELYEFNGVATLTLSDDVKPVSSMTGGLVTQVILVPKMNVSTWDSGLMNRWADALINGVKARLMDNDKEGWGNPRRAQRAGMDYETLKAQAKIETYRRFKTGSLIMTARSWL